MRTTDDLMPVCTPLGKPRRKRYEDEPITVPEEWPTTVPVEPAQPKVPVPA